MQSFNARLAQRRFILRLVFVGALFCCSISSSVRTEARVPTSPGALPDQRWRLLGPFRGGWSEMVDGIANQPDVFMFGAAGGGVWRTENAGRTWTSLFDRGPAAPVGAIAIAPSDSRTIYIGTGQPEPRYDVLGGAGVFRSSDGGRTWASLGLARTRYIARIWVNPNDSKIVLVAAVGHFFGPNPERGVFRSTDGGATWSHVLAIDNATGAIDLTSDPNDPNVLFAAAWQARQYPWQSYFAPVSGPGSGLYTSVDGGKTWAKMRGTGWPPVTLGRISIAAARTARGLRLYAMVDANRAGGLYHSDDGGRSWTLVNPDVALSNYYASRITVAPNDPDTVYTVGQSIRRCGDGGKTCSIITGAPGGDDYHGVWINPMHPDHIATVSDQGTAISVDGGRSWSSWYNQPTGQFYRLAADNRFPYWIYAGQQDSGTAAIASRSDYGAIGPRNWHPVGGEERDVNIPDPADPSIVYNSGLGGDVTRYDDRTGQVGFIGPYAEPNYGRRQTLTKHHFPWITPMAISQRGPTTLYVGGEVLFASRDRGVHWATISPDLTGKMRGVHGCNAESVPLEKAKLCGYGSIWTIAPSARRADEIWVGTDDGLIQLTRDGGRHWNNVTPPAIPVWAKIASIDISQLRAGVAYVAVDNQRQDDFTPHLWKTRDYGATWQNAAGDLPHAGFAAVVRADPMQAGLLYAGTQTGVFVTFDDGRRWLPLGQNLPTACVTDLLVHAGDLIAATQGRAIWTLDDLAPLRELGTFARGRRGAYLFTPEPAYRVRPNNYRDTPLPADEPTGENPPPGAIIDYWLAGRAHAVRLEIRDAAGALVARLTSDPQPSINAALYFSKFWLHPDASLPRSAGMHRVSWNLRYARPRAITYDYSISAVPRSGAFVTPAGAFALPGGYQLALIVDGQVEHAPLIVRQDPRVSVARVDLRASLALSQRIAAGLARADSGYTESAAARKHLEIALGRTRSRAKHDLHLHVQRVLATLTSLLRAPTFEDISGVLASIESNLENSDLAPTETQRGTAAREIALVDRLSKNWLWLRDHDLPRLKTEFSAAGL